MASDYKQKILFAEAESLWPDDYRTKWRKAAAERAAEYVESKRGLYLWNDEASKQLRELFADAYYEGALQGWISWGHADSTPKKGKR